LIANQSLHAATILWSGTSQLSTSDSSQPYGLQQPTTATWSISFSDDYTASPPGSGQFSVPANFEFHVDQPGYDWTASASASSQLTITIFSDTLINFSFDTLSGASIDTDPFNSASGFITIRIQGNNLTEGIELTDLRTPDFSNVTNQFILISDRNGNDASFNIQTITVSIIPESSTLGLLFFAGTLLTSILFRRKIQS
jgi:hypothetical protein